MTKKREGNLVDLMDASDSDNSGSNKPKAWKRLRNGNSPKDYHHPIEVWTHDCNLEDENLFTEWDPFAFGSFYWCGPNPDVDELRWQEKIREEKLDEGAILYFQEEEELKEAMEREAESFDNLQVASKAHVHKPVKSTVCWSNALPTTCTRLWTTNPQRPYIFNERCPEIIDLSKETNSDDD